MKKIFTSVIFALVVFAAICGGASAEEYYNEYSYYDNPPIGWNVTETPTSKNTKNASASAYQFDPPKSISVTETATGVKISWSHVEGVENYRVNYKTKSSEWKKVTITNETSCEFTDLKLGNEYTFRVRCVNWDGSEYISSHIQSKPYIRYLEAPVVSSLENTQNGVLVRWNAVDGAKKYRVFFKPAGGKWDIAGMTTETEFEVAGLPFGTEYAFTVRCMDKNETIFTSEYDSVGMSIVHYFAAPEILTAENTSDGIRVEWKAVEDAEKYRVRYKMANESEWTKATDTTDTGCTIKGLKPGAEYQISVRCIDASGTTNTSPSSESMNVTIKKGISQFIQYKFGKK